MFDCTKPIDIQIYSGGPKACTVTWPSDADWKRRANKVRVKSESIGREKTKSSVIGAEPAALDIFERVRVDKDGSPFDAAEAFEVIDRLEYCELQEDEDGGPSIDLRGDQVTITIGAMRHRKGAAFGGLRHTLRHPSMRQIRDYRNACVDLFAVRRGTEMTQPLGPGEALYDALAVSSNGYAGAVPVIHKDFVVSHLLEAIKELEESGGDAS